MAKCPLCGFEEGHAETCPYHGVEEQERKRTLQIMTMGWECPKCHRVYAPLEMECKSCNRKIKAD